MSIVLVSSAAELQGALASAQTGDVINLAAGNYGNISIASKNFATGITITSADPSHAAVLNSLSVTSSSGITFSGVDVEYTPTAATYAFSSVVNVTNSSNLTFTHDLIKAGVAVNGVAPTASQTDATGNVLGYLTGRGFTLTNSTGVTIQNSEITQIDKGIVISGGSNLSILNNDIHDFRTSSIVGGDVNNVTVSGNQLSDSNPWASGTSYGDHADFIHFWTVPGTQTTASTNITITNNTLNAGAGAPPLGIYLDDNGNNIGFTHVTIANNLILDGVGQGVRLENTSLSSVTGNTLLDTVGDSRHAPGIVADGSQSSVNISGNVGAFANNDANSSTNIHDNTTIQDTNPAGAGYYTPALVSYAESLTSISSVNAYVMANVSAGHAVTSAVDEPPPILSPAIPAATATAAIDASIADSPLSMITVHVSLMSDFFFS